MRDYEFRSDLIKPVAVFNIQGGPALPDTL